MFDLYQSHWVSDQDKQLFIASAPSLQAPTRFNLNCQTQSSDRRLDKVEADLIYQAALAAGMQPLTFLHSDGGISFVQQMLAQSNWSEVS